MPVATVSALSAERAGKGGNKMSEQTLKIDLSDLGKVLKDHTIEQTKLLTEAMRKQPQGRGRVSMPADKSKKIVEQLRNVKAHGWKLTEEWTVVIRNYTQYEVAAHLRDSVWVTEINKGVAGDVARIPYVSDVTFEILGAVGNAFAASWAAASLLSSVTTTLYEAGGWADVPYYLIERFDSNLLEEINKSLAIGAVNAEDEEIMTLIVAGTSTNFAGNVTRLTATNHFYSTNIPSAIKLLMVAGKNARPEECVLYMTPSAYGALLSEMTASTVIAYAAPSMITQGLIERLFGVKIVVGVYRPNQQRTNAATGTVDLCFLMRGKRAVALAPKRDILIETDKQIAERKLRISASHTFGVKILDFKEIVRIWTSRVA